MRPNTTVTLLCPIIPSGINPSIGIGPTQGQRKTLTRVGFEPTTFGLDHRRSTDWATRPEREQTVGMWDVIHKDKFGSAQA